MNWYYELLQAIADAVTLNTPEAETLLSVLLEPVYGPEQAFAVQCVRYLELRKEQ